MTIFLPPDLILFRKAFDEACFRIFASEEDSVFFALLVQLTVSLREHSFLKEIIFQARSKSLQKHKEFSLAALEAFEHNWIKLWKYHRHNYRQRKKLAQIKRIVTSSHTTFQSSLYSQILFSLTEFCCGSPFFRYLKEATVIFNKAQFEIKYWITIEQYFSSSKQEIVIERKISPIKFKKKDKRNKLHLKIIDPTKLSIPLPFKWHVEDIASLFSSKIKEIERRFGLPGRNNDEKRRNIQINAELDFSFCWERLHFLEECYNASLSYPPSKSFPGKWESIKNAAWQSAFDRCEKEALLGAKISFKQKLASKSNTSIDVFVSCDRQIHRKDYEKHLKAIQSYIHARLLIIESSQPKMPNLQLALTGTQRASFLIELAKEFWKINPKANYDEAHEDYLIKCPPGKSLTRSTWESLVRKHKLDPRPKDEKKRGNGKKTL